MNRREFLSAAAAATATLTVSAKDEAKMISIVDCHQHLWTSPSSSSLGQGRRPARRQLHAQGIRRGTKGLNFVKSVYMEVDVVEEQQQKEADYLIELIKSKESITVAAVVSGRPAKGDAFKKYVDQFKEAVRQGFAAGRSQRKQSSASVCRRNSLLACAISATSA